ncbi:hypothetical protein DUI87_25904 [Hirundo rustica rustica]|uniref:Murine leukemia virus integrase C-terminal domain-containing protein n=1 Tax=Hirundo rustica rustica TaxID=333673 RepID=A0A3M0J9R0_HIRRU|nr:hypothetical protein DUI87_25904 [Hirundo rustica rustica]
MPAIPEVEEQITPVVTKIGPYAIKKTGVQKLIVNPKWSLKRVEMGVQVLLMTEAAIRTKERGWIHTSRIKGPVDEPKEWTIPSEPGDTKLTLKRGLGGNELGRPKWSKKHTQDHT